MAGRKAFKSGICVIMTSEHLYQKDGNFSFRGRQEKGGVIKLTNMKSSIHNLK